MPRQLEVRQDPFRNRQDLTVLPVPRSWSALSPEWMTAALGTTFPGAVVDEIHVGPVADGTNRRASVGLTYRRGEGPPSVFVKMQGRIAHRLALVALRALTAEARLARSGISLPLEHPRFYAAGIDGRRLATVVVMDDVTDSGGHPNDATTPLSVDQVRDGLEGLARLHGAYWDRPLPAAITFLRPWRISSTWAPVSRASLARGVRRLDAAGHSGLLPTWLDSGQLDRQFRTSAILAATGPRTVLHGDPHPGNTYALSGDRTGFFDWQLVRTGHWAHDVGYFVVGSLEVEQRRLHERELLVGYLDALRRTGVESPGLPDAWTRYRATPAYGLATWLHTTAAGTFQALDVCLATVDRFATAYRDLETHRSLAADS